MYKLLHTILQKVVCFTYSTFKISTEKTSGFNILMYLLGIVFSIQVENQHVINLSVMQNTRHLQVLESCIVIILVTNQTLIRHGLMTHPSIISNNHAVFYGGNVNEFFVTFI